MAINYGKGKNDSDYDLQKTHSTSALLNLTMTMEWIHV